MATQVEIFKVDFGDTTESINQLKQQLKETKKLFEQAKPNTEDFVKYSTEVKRLDGTIKSLNAVTKENTNALGGVNQASKFAAGSYGELKQQIEKNKKALLELNVESKEFQDTQNDLIALQEKRIEIEKKIPSLFQERIKGAIDESNSLKQLKQDLKAAQSAALNGDGKAAARVAELKDKIEDLRDSTKSLQGTGIERLNNSVGLLQQGFADLDTEKINTAFKSIGTAMKAVPIFLLIEGIRLLIENFDEVISFAKDFLNITNANEQAVKNLTLEMENQVAASTLYKAQINAEIAIMEAQGVSIDKIIEKKRTLAIQEVNDQKRILEVELARLAQAKTETNYFNTAKTLVLQLSGLQDAAMHSQINGEIERQQKINEINNKIAESEKAIIQISTGFKVDVIKANAANELKNKGELNEEKKKLDVDYEAYQQKLFDDEIKRIDEKYDKINKISKESAEYQAKLVQDEIDASDEAYEDKFKNEIFRAKNNLTFVEKNGGDILKAKMDLLRAERNEVLSNDQLTNEERLVIANEFAEKERQLRANEAIKQIEAYKQLNESLKEVSNFYFDEKREKLNSEEAQNIIADQNATASQKAEAQKRLDEDKRLAKKQFDINKAFNIATIGMQTATAIINAFATLPYFANVAAAAAAGTLGTVQTAKVASQEFKYFDGGFTGDGNIHDESTNLGSRPYTYHKGEYVVPNKILSSDKGINLVSQLEAMRRGITPSGISGFFDGGFTAKSASNNVMAANNSEQSIMKYIKNIPAPIVRVTDINAVNTAVSTTVNVSSL